MTGELHDLAFQFDPATVTLADWTAAWPSVKAAIDSLVAAAARSEPVSLATAATNPATFA
jgi:hypothetical protein